MPLRTEHRLARPGPRARTALLGLLILAACAAQASAEPKRRGPTPKVIRPSIVMFPDHPRFAIPGPLGVTTIAAQTWAGPPPAMLDYAPPPPRANWWEPQPSDRWILLKDLQQQDFEAAREAQKVSP